jgi:hypothetical protein
MLLLQYPLVMEDFKAKVGVSQPANVMTRNKTTGRDDTHI